RGRAARQRYAAGVARLRGDRGLHRARQELPLRYVRRRVQDHGLVNPRLLRVLLVDDDRAIHRTVAKMLPGFELCSAYDGPGALVEVETALAQRAEFALVILDVAMPSWGGLDTLERIWALAPDTQALFCTGAALGQRDLQERFGETDAILVVKKPFSQVELA